MSNLLPCICKNLMVQQKTHEEFNICMYNFTCLFQTAFINISLDHLKSQLVLAKVDVIAFL